VWVTGRRSRAAQLRDYVPGTDADGELVLPAVAACAVARYSRGEAVVVDPDCGAGTVLVEALRAGRHTVGITSPNGGMSHGPISAT
jgi:modification methylase